jgi:hypothetical protein
LLTRRAIGWTATPAANASAAIRPANPADKVRALVISSGSTTMASDIDPDTIGLAGATASQNRAVRAAAGGQSLAWLEPCAVGFRSRWCLPEAAGATGCHVPSGAGHAVTAAADPITRCGRYGSSIGSVPTAPGRRR